MLLTLVRPTDNARMNFATIEVCQPGGAAIIFSEKLEFFAKIFLGESFFGKKLLQWDFGTTS